VDGLNHQRKQHLLKKKTYQLG